MSTYNIPANEWTFVGDSGVEVQHDGAGPVAVDVGAQGEVILPDGEQPSWMVRPGNVPVVRAGQEIDPGSEFRIGENGMWERIPA